jgi:3-deoxy-7-phosphoheptulonate synthase
MTGTEDVWKPLPSPAEMLEELPASAEAAAVVARTRAEVRTVLDAADDRLLVIAGPCSVHDPVAALDYAGRLAEAGLGRDLLIVMRVYFEKPRTVTGWKGLINDPGMDGSHDVRRGLRSARRLLLDIVGRGMPVSCEWLDPVVPQYLADLVTWGAIGARTTESQVHRQLASGLPMPVGFKNSTDGDFQVAVEACVAAAYGHTFISVAASGAIGLVTTAGNPDCHVVLRGGRSGPNYEAQYVAKALDLIAGSGLPRRLVVDASHGNSRRDHRRQPCVAAAVADQVAAGEYGLTGVMLESFLIEGRQEPGEASRLAYGQSVTDPCMDFPTTVAVLETLAAAVRWRRRVPPG